MSAIAELKILVVLADKVRTIYFDNGLVCAELLLCRRCITSGSRI